MESHIHGGQPPMPYREKTAWLSLAAMTAAFVPYFAITVAHPPQGLAMPMLRQLMLYAAAVVVQVAILAAGHAYLRLSCGADATAPRDERDRDIERQAITSAYYVLIAGVILVGFIMPFVARAWSIVNAALLAVLAAEVVHYAGIVVRYRRQA